MIIVEIIRAHEFVLRRDSLTLEQRREIAKTFSTRVSEFDVQLEIRRE